ncbi:MAG: GWxTD domain-containing protein [Bryobacteraceae bacterium]
MTRLGWTLIHFLWQGAAIAGLSWAFASTWREARSRYAVFCCGLLAMSAAPLITFALLTDAPMSRFTTLALSDLLSRPAMSNSGAAPFDATALPWLRAVVWMWAAGVAVLSVRLAGGWMLTGRLIKSARPAGAPWQAMAQRAAQRLGFDGILRILASPRIEVPLVAGYVRPVVLFPAAALAHLPVEQIEAILAHEVAHILRRDPLVNLLQSIVETVLFYHPAVWWLSHRIRAERENCCDDLAAACSPAPGIYASALLALEESRSPNEAFALSIRGSDLRARIARLLTPSHDTPRNPLPALLATVMVAALAAICAHTLTAQKAPQPAVVAPRPNPEAHPGPVSLPRTTPFPVMGTIGEGKGAPWPPLDPAMPTQYKKWLNEDVRYLIERREWVAFNALTSDAERDRFIVQFWELRNPTPNSPGNAFKTEFYRRIAYSNERFRGHEPGWKTERGRYYIAFGPPDEIESHPSEGFEQWRYYEVGGIKNMLLNIDTERDKPGRQQELQDRMAKLQEDLKRLKPADVTEEQRIRWQIDRLRLVLTR